MTGLSCGTMRLGLVCLMAASLGGCASEGIELNGKIFDALGMSTSAIGRQAEPKVAQRSPLVIPPDSKKLPEPGSAPPPAVASEQSWPQDPDQKRIAAATEAQRKQEEYCRDGNWKEKAMQDEVAASQGPSGSCGSIFSALSKTLFGN